MRIFKIFAALVAACLSLPAAAQDPGWKGVVTVGAGDNNCTARSLQRAVDLVKNDNGFLPIIWVSNDRHSSFLEYGTVTINNLSLEIIGGFDDCNDVTPSGYTKISGAGDPSESVFNIGGHSRVWLAHLEIADGDEGQDDNGGGIDFNGTGELNLEHIRLMNNRAGYGGGLFATTGNDVNSSLEVKVGDDVVIGDNVADRNGGGMYVSGSTKLTMNGKQLAFHRNRALGVQNGNNIEDGQGGGLYVRMRAAAEIRAAPFPGYPVFWRNEARRGGGLVLTGISSVSGLTSLKLSTHPQGEPMSLGDNRASVAGGAIYIGVAQVDTSRFSSGTVCADDTIFRDNVAPDGAVVYASSISPTVGADGQGRFIVNGVSDGCFGSHYRCPANARCTSFDGNRSEKPDGTRTDGSVIEFPGGPGGLALHRARMTGNTAGSLIHVGDHGENLFQIDNTLIAGNNVVSRYLIDTDANESHLRHLTVTDNTINGPSMLRLVESSDNATTSLSTITNSLFWQLGKFALEHVGSREQTVIQYILSSDITTLPPHPTVITDDPRLNVSNGDYIPAFNSVVVDFAPKNIPGEEDDGFTGDLLGNNRTRDLPRGSDPLFTRDLGSYEVQQALPDRVFRNGFE